MALEIAIIIGKLVRILFLLFGIIFVLCGYSKTSKPVNGIMDMLLGIFIWLVFW